MATKSYAGLKAILIEKLTALIGEGSEAVFAGVYGVNETQTEGYPMAYVIEKTGGGHILDTHRNEREWQFTVAIHQNISNKTPEQAYEALLDAVDRVIEMLDQDPMLLDNSGNAQCKWARVVPVAFEYSTQDTAVHRALLTVAIVDMVNRYAEA